MQIYAMFGFKTYMNAYENKKNDTVVLVFSIIAVLFAGFISMATISNHSRKMNAVNSSDPFVCAEAAARAGLDAAKWHIECHGRVEKGSLSPHYFINGALYSVEWDDVDLRDSTVTVRSEGDFSSGGQHYRMDLSSRIKLGFLPTHRQPILSAYYSKVRSLARLANSN